MAIVQWTGISLQTRGADSWGLSKAKLSKDRCNCLNYVICPEIFQRHRTAVCWNLAYFVPEFRNYPVYTPAFIKNFIFNSIIRGRNRNSPRSLHRHANISTLFYANLKSPSVVGETSPSLKLSFICFRFQEGDRY